MAIATAAAIGAGIAGVSSLIGAVLQARNNAKASGAEKKEIDRLDELASQIERPDFSVEEIGAIEPQLADLVFSYNPESIPFIQEIAPQVVEKSPVAQQAQQAQLGALGRFEELATTGEDASLIAAREGAERESMEALSRAQAERETMAQRRGLGLGSGTQLALQQADLTATAQRQQEMNEKAAADAALRRMQASQQAASLGGQMTGQELALAGQNVDIINAFNQRQAMREQQVAQQNVMNKNEEALLAAQQAQTLENENVRRQNEAARFNVGTQRGNLQARQQAKQQDFDAQMRQYGARQNVGMARLGQVGRAAERTGRTISGITQTVGSAAKGLGGIIGGS